MSPAPDRRASIEELAQIIARHGISMFVHDNVFHVAELEEFVRRVRPGMPPEEYEQLRVRCDEVLAQTKGDTNMIVTRIHYGHA